MSDTPESVGQPADSTDDRQGPGGSDRAQLAFRNLSQMVLGTSLDDVLDRVAHLARDAIPGADEVLVTLMEGDRAHSIGFTGDVALQLDERQYVKGFGPCMDAAISGGNIHIRDTADEQLYPEFARQARRAGVTNTLSVGMPIPQRTVGAINMYGMHSGEFDEDAVAVAVAFASYAAVAVANADLYTNVVGLARDLRTAMTSRAVIEQAKGVLMVEQNCSADEAFALLARASQASNRKLRDIAAEIVARRGSA